MQKNTHGLTMREEIKNGVLHTGDCLEVMAGMDPESVRLIVTSPPYNLKQSSGNGMKCAKGSLWPKAELRNGYADHEDCMTHSDYVEWQRDCLSAMMRLLQPDGAIFYNHKWRVQNGLIQNREDIVTGFPVRQILIWDRGGGHNFNETYFLPNYEVIYLICKPGFKLAKGANLKGCVWRVHQESNNLHPAPFPLGIAANCINSVEDGLILDPFMGSGTTALAAEHAGRKWAGIEKSTEYIEMAKDRLLSELL